MDNLLATGNLQNNPENIFYIFFHFVDAFCLNEDGCVHWTYRANSGKCYLKSSNGDMYAYSGTVGCSLGNSNTFLNEIPIVNTGKRFQFASSSRMHSRQRSFIMVSINNEYF